MSRASSEHNRQMSGLSNEVLFQEYSVYDWAEAILNDRGINRSHSNDEGSYLIKTADWSSGLWRYELHRQDFYENPGDMPYFGYWLTAETPDDTVVFYYDTTGEFSVEYESNNEEERTQGQSAEVRILEHIRTAPLDADSPGFRTAPTQLAQKLIELERTDFGRKNRDGWLVRRRFAGEWRTK